MNGVPEFLEDKLKLKVNRSKSAVDRPWKRKFLGFFFTNTKDTQIRIAPKSLDRYKDRIRALPKRSWSISLEERVRRPVAGVIMVLADLSH
jgi:hypothetical protein